MRALKENELGTGGSDDCCYQMMRDQLNTKEFLIKYYFKLCYKKLIKQRKVCKYPIGSIISMRNEAQY